MRYLLPLTFLFVHSFNVRLALGLSPTYANCQIKKPAGVSPLQGCPEGTIYVSTTDATYTNFTSIQTAIDSLPETGDATILIAQGEYFEMLSVDRTPPLTLLGQLNSSSASPPQDNLVKIWNSKYVENGISDLQTATLSVAAPYGQDFGNVDFRVYNIDFENRAANYSIAPALAVAITYTNASFYGCIFDSWQDTWYTGYNANTYVVDSIIYGQVDYLFGNGVAFFQSMILANRACGGGITAWQGLSGTNRGVYISDSQIIRSPDASPSAVTYQSCYLARPWNVDSVAVFLRTYMDDSVAPKGYTAWYGGSLPDTTYYAEYDSFGSGGNMSARVPQAHTLNETEAAQFTVESVFGGVPDWIDFGYHFS